MPGPLAVFIRRLHFLSSGLILVCLVHIHMDTMHVLFQDLNSHILRGQGDGVEEEGGYGLGQNENKSAFYTR